jgi:hypothetical protein
MELGKEEPAVWIEPIEDAPAPREEPAPVEAPELEPDLTPA